MFVVAPSFMSGRLPRHARSSSLSTPAHRRLSLPVMSQTQSSQRSQDTDRRRHALAELLSTELGYLLDLRSLVSVYLRLLPVLKIRSSLPLPYASSSNPTITYFPRPPSLRTHSHPHLSSTDTHRAEKTTTRHLFSASDLDAITRNAEDILHFHESLVHRLRQALSPLDISFSLSHIPTDTLDVRRAINAVASVFLDHAPGFDQYQSFCSGHAEAFDIVRKVQRRYPAEWDAFELRCATLAADIQVHDVAHHPSDILLDLSKRRHSLSSLDPLSTEDIDIRVPTISASESGHAVSHTSKRPRLMFMDYMIKPVQRVCRYPLLFDQLQDRPASRKSNSTTDDSASNGQDAVKTALWTMRTVASLVDEARRQQDLFAKSSQILSRISQGLLTCAASHNRPLHSTSLSAFLSSLAPCHLSGSLDVIHYRGTNMARVGTVRAKYLGAFLFPGGFLVLVKVAKSKTYEPKHWFNLRPFELVDSNLDDVLLPSWFRLSSKAHMFEFAASCRREKDIWVEAIRRAIAEDVPWSDEPPSSLQVDFTTLSLQDNAQFESISPLPTIQSIPELDDIESVVRNPAESQVFLCVEDSAATGPPVVGPGRRSSVATLSAPIPESNTFHLVRSTAVAREQVDRGLLDVFSEKCLTARFHAHTHEEDLFEAQRITRSFSRSTSALTMASAMSVAAKNRLTKRESVLVPRKKSFIKGNGDTENCLASAHSVVSKSVKRRQHPSRLKIVAIKTTSQEGDEGSSEPFLESPSPMSMSHCSSVSFAPPLTTSAPLSTSLVKADGLHSHSELLNVRQNDCAPKRSKSMIENVRGFFTPRPASPPTTALNREPSARSSVSNSSLLRWWSRESLRRRVRSAPDMPSEELPTALTTRSLHVQTRSMISATDRPYSHPDIHCLYSETLGSSAAEFGVGDPSQKKKGIFSSRGSQRRCAAFTGEEDPTPVTTRIRRNFSFLHRFTRDCDDTLS